MENKAIAFDLMKRIVQELSDRKAQKIEVIDVTEVSQLADYFVVASGTSSTHVKALADAVEEKVDVEGTLSHHREGYSSASWILLDYKDVVTHIFYGETRDFYNLERLWADGEKVPIDSLGLDLDRSK